MSFQLIMKFSRQEHWSGKPFPFPGYRTQVSCIAGRFFTVWAMREAPKESSVQFSSVQLLSRVWLFAIPWIAARQASMSITNSRSSPKPTSIELVMPSSHLILCRPLLLLPPIPPSIRVFSNESVSFNISPSSEHPGMVSFRMDWLDLLAVQGTLKSPPTPQFKSISSSVLSLLHSPYMDF